MRWGGPDEVTLKPMEPPAPRESPENLPDDEPRGRERGRSLLRSRRGRGGDRPEPVGTADEPVDEPAGTAATDVAPDEPAETPTRDEPSSSERPRPVPDAPTRPDGPAPRRSVFGWSRGPAPSSPPEAPARTPTRERPEPGIAPRTPPWRTVGAAGAAADDSASTRTPSEMVTVPAAKAPTAAETAAAERVAAQEKVAAEKAAADKAAAEKAAADDKAARDKAAADTAAADERAAREKAAAEKAAAERAAEKKAADEKAAREKAAAEKAAAERAAEKKAADEKAAAEKAAAEKKAADDKAAADKAATEKAATEKPAASVDDRQTGLIRKVDADDDGDGRGAGAAVAAAGAGAAVGAVAGRYRTRSDETTSATGSEGHGSATTVERGEPTPAVQPEPEPESEPESAAERTEITPSDRTDVMSPVEEPAPAGPRPGVVRDRRRRRRVLFAFVLAALVLAAFLGLVALITDHAGSDEPAAAPAPNAAVTVPPPGPAAPPAPPQLPRGGTTFFPQHRVVAYYGTAGTDSLGILGEGSPQDAATKLEAAAAPFASPGKTVLPAMELIVGIANSTPGPDGTYHSNIDEAEAREYLAAARAKQQVMIIDVQPGRADFMTAVRPWEALLREPDVGLALDPEWRMGPGQVPGEQIGTVTADEVNQVSSWLANIVATANLPQKLFVVHQFTSNMITNPERLQTPPQLAVVQHIDGFGAPPNKIGKYQQLQRPQQLHLGFKLFIDEDTPTLMPAEALALAPAPDLVTYQ
ncbi:hypothetical protein WCD74_08770 [Actinomycetospora sp. OC33-EN08]|uniref:Uncharacterized protein n=1 Tax=Actinomycetospora aurantiaca TaxID=3129233 RepID=A0ABU8MLJ5_9PSEU